MADAADHPGIKSGYPVVGAVAGPGGESAAAQHGEPRGQRFAADTLHLFPRRLLSRAFLAGGTTLLDLMKLDVMQPDAIIDINPLAEAGYGRIELNQHALLL
jgi:FAD binding domain in molybdopterin dehydrogenase